MHETTVAGFHSTKRATMDTLVILQCKGLCVWRERERGEMLRECVSVCGEREGRDVERVCECVCVERGERC